MTMAATVPRLSRKLASGRIVIDAGETRTIRTGQTITGRSVELDGELRLSGTVQIGESGRTRGARVPGDRA